MVPESSYEIKLRFEMFTNIVQMMAVPRLYRVSYSQHFRISAITTL